MSEVNTPGAIPESGAAGTGGDGTASQSTGLKDVLSRELGKEFKSDEAAIKAVKDTFSFVGKAGSYQKVMKDLSSKFGDESTVLKKFEDFMSATGQNSASPTGSAAPQPSNIEEQVRELKHQLDEQSLYAEKPELKPFSDLLKELRGATGKSLKEVAESETFKKYAEKSLAFEKAESTKSVLHSNPRLGAARNKLTEARDAVKSGDMTSARSKAVSAVLDSVSEK